jgi:hypothetical protein
MSKGPRGEKRLADAIGAAVKTMRGLTRASRWTPVIEAANIKIN